MSNQTINLDGKSVCSYTTTDDVTVEISLRNEVYDVHIRAGNNARVEVVNFDESLATVWVSFGDKNPIQVKELPFKLAIEENSESNGCSIPSSEDVEAMIGMFSEREK